MKGEEGEDSKSYSICFQFYVCVLMGLMIVFHYGSLSLTDYHLQKHREDRTQKKEIYI